MPCRPRDPKSRCGKFNRHIEPRQFIYTCIRVDSVSRHAEDVPTCANMPAGRQYCRPNYCSTFHDITYAGGAYCCPVQPGLCSPCWHSGKCWLRHQRLEGVDNPNPPCECAHVIEPVCGVISRTTASLRESQVSFACGVGMVCARTWVLRWVLLWLGAVIRFEVFVLYEVYPGF